MGVGVRDGGGLAFIYGRTRPTWGLGYGGGWGWVGRTPPPSSGFLTGANYNES